MFPKKLQQKLNDRHESNSSRKLGVSNSLIDFCSNDYLGFSRSKVIYAATYQFIKDNEVEHNGATGSRLLSGNHKLYMALENVLQTFHNSAAALVYNSGYDANLGLFSSVPQRGDIILYDEYIHASIRDGILMSHAKSYKFKHNNIEDLETLLKRYSDQSEIYVATESVFSMDGDTPDLVAWANLCKTYKAHLIVDEAHAVGVFGENGCGLIQEFGIEDLVFARTVTFGKAIGSHGEKWFISSESAIHCCIISGNDKVKTLAEKFQMKGFEIKPILSPTVSENQERLRFCIHAYNSEEEITTILSLLKRHI